MIVLHDGSPRSREALPGPEPQLPLMLAQPPTPKAPHIMIIYAYMYPTTNAGGQILNIRYPEGRAC
jgi:hypothetical protein